MLAVTLHILVRSSLQFHQALHHGIAMVVPAEGQCQDLRLLVVLVELCVLAAKVINVQLAVRGAIS